MKIIYMAEREWLESWRNGLCERLRRRKEDVRITIRISPASGRDDPSAGAREAIVSIAGADAA